MKNTTDKIERILIEMLQSDIELCIGKKNYRRGKLKNFKMFDLYVQLSLIMHEKERKIELPIPFFVDYMDGVAIFSYKISDMGSFGIDLNEKIQKYLGIPKSKLYNSILTIKRS